MQGSHLLLWASGSGASPTSVLDALLRSEPSFTPQLPARLAHPGLLRLLSRKAQEEATSYTKYT